jgi:hypothetical protein
MTMVETRRAASDLIDAIVENMRSSLEPLKYTTLAASRYTVYLSPAEFARLEGILPRLEAEARRALDEELAKLNTPSRLARHLPWMKTKARDRVRFENADTQWHIEFLCDPDGELAAEGDIVVHSDLMLPAAPDLGVGERTRRITTVRTGTRSTTDASITPAAGTRAPAAVYARLVYDDQQGRHEHPITSDTTTIGRGGIAYPVDVRIASSEDVSREHARIRRDPASGQFVLIDLSSLGTTLNGRHVPRGFEERDGARHENGASTPLPDRARIGLADTIFLDFERVTS